MLIESRSSGTHLLKNSYSELAHSKVKNLGLPELVWPIWGAQDRNGLFADCIRSKTGIMWIFVLYLEAVFLLYPVYGSHRSLRRLYFLYDLLRNSSRIKLKAFLSSEASYLSHNQTDCVRTKLCSRRRTRFWYFFIDWIKKPHKNLIFGKSLGCPGNPLTLRFAHFLPFKLTGRS